MFLILAYTQRAIGKSGSLLDLNGGSPMASGTSRVEKPVVIVSKDEDFVDRWLLSDQPVPLVWIRKGNCSNEALLAWIGPLWPDVVKRLEQGDKLIELRA